MGAGYAVVAGDVNTKAGALVTSLWDDLDAIRRFHLWLTDATHSDAFLNNLGITGSSASGDVATLRNSIADLGGTSGLVRGVARHVRPGGRQ